MSRAHIQGFDSNPAQFERMGNPWITPREQQELGDPTRRERKLNARLRPCQLSYKEVKRIARQLTPEEAKAKRIRDNLQQVRNFSRQARGEEVREAMHWEPRKIVGTAKPLRDSELSEFDPRRLASDADRLAKQHAQAVADVQRVKLDQLQKALGKMAKRFEKL